MIAIHHDGLVVPFVEFIDTICESGFESSTSCFSLIFFLSRSFL